MHSDVNYHEKGVLKNKLSPINIRVWVPVFMAFFCNIPDGLVIHASNSGELSWPGIERSHNLLNNTISSL